MAKTRLYPPQLEGSLPAFYKKYNDENELTGAIINIPFGVNRAISISSIGGLVIKIRTTSTNTYLVSDYKAIQYDAESNIASFEFKYDEKSDKNLASLFNEGQYYRVQLAFVDKSNEIGYYSTVGVIKCVAPPLEDGVRISGYSKDSINQLKTEIIGQYFQNTYYGDTTEKVYSYKFDIYNSTGILLETSGELVHDVTQDVASDSSEDKWHIYNDYPVGEVLNLQYTVTTLNGLVIASPLYRISKTISIDPEFPIEIHAVPNFDNGYINITLSSKAQGKEESETIYKIVTQADEYNEEFEYLIKQGNDSYLSFNGTRAEWDELVSRNLIYTLAKSITYGEAACSGYFLITRASSQDNFFTWVNIARFVMISDFPSSFSFMDRTVEQGIEYKYAIQQYNIHGLESNKIYQTDYNGVFNTVIADFEDMFLSDGGRQLRIRFNPKVTSFKSTIPEQKIETIGSKYPFIFRNGSVCYKEFPIGGLISYQMDDATLFLDKEELRQAGILEKTRTRRVSNFDSYTDAEGHEIHFYLEERTMPVYDKYTGIKLYDKHYAVGIRLPETEWIKRNDKSYAASSFTFEGESDEPNAVRMDKNLTTENLQGERYFKLKVLDWLNNGKVKLFRSPAEGNYLVRLLNVSLSPTDSLGRMLHSFTCTGYEIADLTYDNLISLGLINESTEIHYEEQWATIDMHELIKDYDFDTNDFITISPIGITINSISIQDFAPGDQIRITYGDGDSVIYTIGVTGSLDLSSDERTIVKVEFKPNPEVYGDFERNFIYSTTNATKTKFDAIKDILMRSVVAEQFVGPQENLLDPFILRDVAYGVRDEDGLVLNPASREEGFNAIYNDLKAHHRFNYFIDDYRGETTEKFTGLKLDYLHVVKRNVIPIFCYDEEVTATSKFGVTPFGKGYVNNQPITNFLDYEKNITYVNPVITQEENGLHTVDNGVNIDDIDTLLQENHLMQHPFDILKVFIFNEDTESWEPIADGERYQYFDCYTKDWWAPGVSYDPSFSINELDVYPERNTENEPIILSDYIGDNNIYLNDIEEIHLYNINEVNHIRLGNGVFAEISMQMRVVDYDIEESDNDVRLAKEAYLAAKERFEETLDSVMENSDYFTDIYEQYKKYSKLLQQIETQLITIEQNIDQSDLVFSAAKKRVISQKRQVWYVLMSQLKEIVKFLKTLKVYTQITDKENDKISVIGEDSPFDAYQSLPGIESSEDGLVMVDTKVKSFYLPNEKPSDLTSNVNNLDTFKLFLEYRKTGQQYTGNNLTDEEYLFSDDSNYIMLGELGNDVVRILKDDGTYLENKFAPIGSTEEAKTSFDRVNSFFYIYIELLKHQIEEEAAKIADYEAKIKALESQCGELVGGYLSDYDETNPPPENTIVYYDYYLQLKDAEIQTVIDSYNKQRENLIDKLLLSIFSEDADLLTGFTDEYIQENAAALIELLISTDEQKLGRIPQRERELKELQDKFFPSIACLIFNLKDENGNLLINNVSEAQRNDTEHIFHGTLKSIKQTTPGENDTTITTYTDSTTSHIYTAILAKLNDNEITLESLYTDYIKVYEDGGSNTPVKQFLIDNFMDVAAYCAAYELYSNNINSALTTMRQQLAILQQIVVDPGSISRAYGEIINEYSASGVSQLKDSADEIKDVYITNTSSTVNTHFKQQVDEQGNQIITKTFEDLANISADASREDKANIILGLLVDQYNRSQAASVNKYLNNYTKDTNTDQESAVDELMDQLRSIEYVFQNRYITLMNERKTYSDQRDKYARDLESLKDSITTFERERLESIERKTEAENLEAYDKIIRENKIQESEELIDDLISNIINQTNVGLLKNYIRWILWLQDSLQKQIGQIYAGIHNGTEYANMMKKYINLYEEEAFKFLHWFDALPEDLDAGFQGIGGMDEKFKDPNNFFLKDYKDILYLSAPTKYTSNEFLDNTDNANRIDREAAYVGLKKYIKELFTYHLKDEHNKPTAIRVGLQVILPSEGDETPQHPHHGSLIEFKTPEEAVEQADLLLNHPEQIEDPEILAMLEDPQLRGSLSHNLLFAQQIIDYGLSKYYPMAYEFRSIMPMREDDGYTALPSRERNEDLIELRYIYKENSETGELEHVYLNDNTNCPMYEIVPAPNGSYILLPEGVNKKPISPTYLSVTGYTMDRLYENCTHPNAIKAFNQAIYTAIAQNYRVVWAPPNLPLEISFQPYDFLYSSVNIPDHITYSLTRYFTPEAAKERDNLVHGETEISVTYNHNFDQALGLIVYDYNEVTGQYQNCIASLREREKEIRQNLSEYLLVQYGIFLAEHSGFFLKYQEIAGKRRTAGLHAAEALRLVEQCQFIDENQKAANMSDDELERQQLLYLLEDALEQYNNYKTQEEYWAEKERELLENAPDLQYYQMYLSVLPELNKKYKDSITSFNQEYEQMQKKLDHYLYLLFNNEPYGHVIDRTIAQSPTLFEVEGNSEGMYNFGIAYALDRYKDGILQGDESISFSDILESKNNIEKVLSEHFNPFVKVIPVYQTNASTGESILITKYKTDMFYKNPTNHKYEKYFKINDEQWEIDLNEGRIYSTEYPSLNDILNVFTFELVPPGILYDPQECYYFYNNETETYTEAQITNEDYNQVKSVLYWKKRNGGLLGLLDALTAGTHSTYLQEIKNAYLGSVELYKTLEKQSLGDQTAKDELLRLRDEYAFQVDTLRQILDQFDGDANFDNEGGLDDIIRALAEFLRILTVTYVTKVERSYGVI